MRHDHPHEPTAMAHAMSAPAAVADRRAPALDDREVAERALRIARSTARGILGDEHRASDVAQEVALVALRRRAALRDPQALEAWLYRIAVRAALREARASDRRRSAEERAAATAGAAVTPGPADEASPALLALAGLPARQRAALTLRYVHDLDDRAIARALGCRAGTVRSLLSRGREALRAVLEDPTDGGRR